MNSTPDNTDDEENAEVTAKFIKEISDKFESLREFVADCWVCGIPTNSWGVLIPEDKEHSLGFGDRGDGTTRIIFFPVCQSHDTEDITVLQQIHACLNIKRQMFTN